VRPEDDKLFKSLCIINVNTEKIELKAMAIPFTPFEQKVKSNITMDSAGLKSDVSFEMSTGQSATESTAMLSPPTAPILIPEEAETRKLGTHANGKDNFGKVDLFGMQSVENRLGITYPESMGGYPWSTMDGVYFSRVPNGWVRHEMGTQITLQISKSRRLLT
jgi:hypothetical protein